MNGLVTTSDLLPVTSAVGYRAGDGKATDELQHPAASENPTPAPVNFVQPGAGCGRRRWTVILEESPSAQPGIVRLRKFLKMALRGYQLRAIEVSEVQVAAGGTPSNETGDDNE